MGGRSIMNCHANDVRILLKQFAPRQRKAASIRQACTSLFNTVNPFGHTYQSVTVLGFSASVCGEDTVNSIHSVCL